MARLRNGFVKVHRSLDGSKIGRDGYAIAIWVKLIMWANWYETKLDGEPIKIGELVTGIDELAEQTGFGRSTVHRKLVLMESEKMLVRSKGQRGTKITILNYEKYQGDEKSLGTPCGTTEGQQRDETGTTEGQQRDLIKNLNNIRSKEDKKGEATPLSNTSGYFSPHKKLDLMATLAKTRVVHALQEHGVDHDGARTEIGEDLWSMLMAKYPRNTWGQIAAEYMQHIKREKSALFEVDLKKHFEAQILTNLSNGRLA